MPCADAEGDEVDRGRQAAGWPTRRCAWVNLPLIQAISGSGATPLKTNIRPLPFPLRVLLNSSTRIDSVREVAAMRPRLAMREAEIHGWGVKHPSVPVAINGSWGIATIRLSIPLFFLEQYQAGILLTRLHCHFLYRLFHVFRPDLSLICFFCAVAVTANSKAPGCFYYIFVYGITEGWFIN
jgi:hypothetical protein